MGHLLRQVRSPSAFRSWRSAASSSQRGDYEDAHVGARRRRVDQRWAEDDLLFVSNYGEGDQRRIAFAHFSRPSGSPRTADAESPGTGTTSTRRFIWTMLPGSSPNTSSWPDEEDDCRGLARAVARGVPSCATGEVMSQRRRRCPLVWRNSPGRSVTALSSALDDRVGVRTAHPAHEGVPDRAPGRSGRGRVRGHVRPDYCLWPSFRAHRRPEPRKTADGLTAHLRTNPFLGELMEAFFSMWEGHQDEDWAAPVDTARIDFDELGVTSEVVDLLDSANTNMDAVVRDFGDQEPPRRPGHPLLRALPGCVRQGPEGGVAGVFYTPRPVVSYIVRSRWT